MREWLRNWLGIKDYIEPAIFPIEIACYVGSNNKNDEVGIGGYLRGNILTIWFEGLSESAFRGDDGHLMFIPFGIEDTFRYGGVGPFVRGTSWLRSERLDINLQGTACIKNGIIYPMYANGERGVGDGLVYVHDTEIRPAGKAWPLRTYYGLEGCITILLP